MTGDKITYGESVECPGRWRRMDYETTVKEGETDQSAGDRAQSFVQNFLSQPANYSHPISEINNYTTFDRTALIPIEEPKITPEQEISDLLTEISNATAETINQWKIPALRNVKTKGAYILRLKQLNIQN